ncbi:MAG: HD-GYP domain-containing protein [Candidatus Omnitrophica bacterium]|nr:HD-GYP domain-containing protein [Candidatus Omnitrophota bacterium]
MEGIKTFKNDNFKKFLFFFYEIVKYTTLNLLKEKKSKILNQILKKTVKFMGGRAGNIRIYNSRTKNLTLVASYGTGKKYIEDKKNIKIGEGIAGLVFQKNKLLAVKNLKESKIYIKPSLALEKKMISLISAPLNIGNKKLGVFSLYYPFVKNFTKEEKGIYTLLSNFIALIITIQNIYYELSDTYVGIINMIVKELEEKDEYLKGHSENVRRYAIMIGKEMKLPKEEIKVLSELTAIHDVGKIFVDNIILTKPDKLNEKEWEIIKKHPEIGAKIVSQIRRFKDGISIIRHHHERVNGNGYPNGISGDNISLIAKIVSVADAIDAMLSDRPYREALSIERVKQELIKNMGTQFDSEVVKVALKLIENGKITEKS